ncbi:AAA family ATPase, partial [Vibrio splendidus]
FNHFSPLSDSQDVLNNLSESERFYAARCLSNLFELDSKLSLVRRKDRNDVVFEFSGRNSTYNQLSDGFKSIVTLFLDILTTAKMFGFESAEQFNGIVLIDELGTHLHPKWRIKIVRELRSIFTHAQFICTTHEPLCLRGLNSDEIVVLKKEGNKSVKIISELPKTEGMSCEQLLTSVHFGLHSTTDLELNYKFARYYELLAGDSESDECKAIESELSEMGVLRGILGGTRREQLVYRAIDKLIAQSESTDIEELIDSSTLTDELSALWKIS